MMQFQKGHWHKSVSAEVRVYIAEKRLAVVYWDKGHFDADNQEIFCQQLRTGTENIEFRALDVYFHIDGVSKAEGRRGFIQWHEGHIQGVLQFIVVPSAKAFRKSRVGLEEGRTSPLPVEVQRAGSVRIAQGGWDETK